MCDNQEERDYPKGSRASKVADAGLAVLGGISGMPLVTEPLRILLKRPLEEKQERFFTGIQSRLSVLEEEISCSLQNESDVAHFWRLYQIYMKEGSKDHQDSLIECAVKIALGRYDSSDIEISDFLLFLENVCNEYHIRLLVFFSVERDTSSTVMGSRMPLLKEDEVLSTLEDSFIKRLWGNLQEINLVENADLNTHMRGSSLGLKQTTERGDRFLQLVRPHIENG